MHSQHIKKIAGLNALIVKISGCNDVEDHIELVCESLQSIHKGKPKDEQFLSIAHLQLFIEYLNALPKFTKPLLKYKKHYEAFKEVVKKIAGGDEIATMISFLNSQFPFLSAKDLSWSSIFDQLENLACNMSSRSYFLRMKKLLDKFTNDESVEFFHEMYPETLETKIFNHPILLDLKKLCNHIAELRSQRKSTEHLLNFRRSVISCLVSSCQKKQLRKAGWEVEKKLYKSCKRKRNDEEKFLDIDPVTKAGRKSIDKELKDEIERLWLSNSRAAAKTMVTNPENRSERRPGRRLSKPAIHIIVSSDIYKEKRASYGTIWNYRLWWVLPPVSNDGLCHWCLTLRNHIAYIHKQIPHTDPESIEGKKQENQNHSLRL